MFVTAAASITLAAAVTACAPPSLPPQDPSGGAVPGASATADAPEAAERPSAAGTEASTWERQAWVVEPSGERLCLAVAESPQQMSRGLGEMDEPPTGTQGMVFTSKGVAPPAFWMRGARFDIDIWFIGQDGEVLSSSSMEVCDKDCPITRTPHGAVAAIELPASGGAQVAQAHTFVAAGSCG